MDLHKWHQTLKISSPSISALPQLCHIACLSQGTRLLRFSVFKTPPSYLCFLAQPGFLLPHSLSKSRSLTFIVPTRPTLIPVQRSSELIRLYLFNLSGPRTVATPSIQLLLLKFCEATLTKGCFHPPQISALEA